MPTSPPLSSAIQMGLLGLGVTMAVSTLKGKFPWWGLLFGGIAIMEAGAVLEEKGLW